MPVKGLMRGLCALLGVIVLAGCGSTSQPGAAEKDSGSPVAGKSYTDRSWMPTTDWMAELLGD